MKTSIKVLGIALVALLVASGLAAATGGFGPAAADAEQRRAGDGSANGYGNGPVADADRPMDGQNSPWVTGDERLERFQERFGLTDAQVEQIRVEVTAMIQDGADRDAVRAQVQTMLEEFGVDAPALGPMDGQRAGDGPHGPRGPADGATRHGGFGAGGAGPHGPADGSCTN